MNRPHGNRARLGGVLLVAALGALALLALPGLAATDHGPRSAGTIESFDPETGKLAIDLAKGDTIAGLVVRRTQIRCGEGRRHHRHQRRAPSAAASEARLRVTDRDGADLTDRAADEAGHVEPSGDDEVTGNDTQPDHDRRRDRCDARDLVEGAVVRRAEMVLTHGDAFYSKIILAKQSDSLS